MLASLAFVVVLAASGAATETAAPPPSAAPAAPALAADKPAAKEEKLICKYEAETGTRFTKKICLTPAQMKARRDEARKAVADIQTNAGIAPAGN